MGFSRQEHWRGLLFLLQGLFPTQGSNSHLLRILHWKADSLLLSHWGSQKSTLLCCNSQIKKCPRWVCILTGLGRLTHPSNHPNTQDVECFHHDQKHFRAPSSFRFSKHPLWLLCIRCEEGPRFISSPQGHPACLHQL